MPILHTGLGSHGELVSEAMEDLLDSALPLPETRLGRDVTDQDLF